MKQASEDVRLSRRSAMLGLAGVALPVPGWAQATPGTRPVAEPPLIPPTAPTPLQAPIPSVPAPLLVPVLPRAGPGSAIDPAKTYYVFFDQAIDVGSMRALRRQLAMLTDAGVSHIVLVLNSGGGLLLETLITYSFIRALPALVQTHAQGLVASAATALFLAGQSRSADRGARFLFHPFTTTVAGVLTTQQNEEQLAFSQSLAAAVSDIYQERTSLTAEEIKRFDHDQVIYTADQAAQLGIVQTVADLKLPDDKTARILLIE